MKLAVRVQRMVGQMADNPSLETARALAAALRKSGRLDIEICAVLKCSEKTLKRLILPDSDDAARSKP